MGTRSSSHISNQRKERSLKQAHFLKELGDIFRLNDGDSDFTMAQHLIHLLRRKGNLTDPYYWDDDQLMRKLSSYKRELRDNLTDEH